MKKIYIELSDICHLACSFCPAPKGKRGAMSVEDFGHCLREALPFSRRIALHILGDACALENLSEYLKIAREMKILPKTHAQNCNQNLIQNCNQNLAQNHAQKSAQDFGQNFGQKSPHAQKICHAQNHAQKSPQIEIVTSGAFFGKHQLEMLLTPPIYQLSISLEAGVDNFAKRDFGKDFGKQDSICKDSSNIFNQKRFGAYLDCINALLCAHKENPQIFLNLRIQNLRLLQDNATLSAICAHLAPLVDFEFLSRQTSKNLTQIKEAFLAGEIKSLLDANGRIRLWKHALLVVKSSFVWAGFGDFAMRKYHKCHALTKQVGILSNGVVVPCCMDAQGAINLGNIFETPLDLI